MQVQFCWRKVCIEYYKRMDPSLPFYYHTATHDRFYEGPRPQFSVPATSVRRKRPRRREQLGPIAGSRPSGQNSTTIQLICLHPHRYKPLFMNTLIQLTDFTTATYSFCFHIQFICLQPHLSAVIHLTDFTILSSMAMCN